MAQVKFNFRLRCFNLGCSSTSFVFYSWETKVTENQATISDEKLRILHFLIHRTPTLSIGYHYKPSPHPTLVHVIQSGAEMIQQNFLFGR